MKFYILVSRRIEYLKDHVKSIPFKDQVVVINSLDNDFIDQASTYCQENSIEHYVTESDGTAATGKNSVMKLFLESDNNHMVQVDGDDKITEYGYKKYKSISQSENPPDILVLYNQWQIQDTKFSIDENGNEKTRSTSRNQPWIRNRGGSWEKVSAHYDSLKIKTKNHLEQDELLLWATERVFTENFCWSLGEGDDNVRESFNRMVFYSRKAAKYINFDNKLKIGEDIMEFFRMKKLCYDGVINVQRLNENPNDNGTEFTYLYRDTHHDNVVKQLTYDPENDVVVSEWFSDINNYIIDNELDKKYKCIENWMIPDYKDI